MLIGLLGELEVLDDEGNDVTVAERSCERSSQSWHCTSAVWSLLIA